MFEKFLSLFERLVAAVEKLSSLTPATTTTAAAATAPTKPARAAKPAKETPPPADDLDLDGGGAADDDFLGTSEPAKKYTLAEVRDALVKHGQRHNDKNKPRAVLKAAGGVEILSELKEDKFAAVIEAANK